MEATKPVLLTVDDDPGVSRAVARDLRRRYGQDHRIVRAESGSQALEALREIKLRGDPVAVLLADYRMPEMSGLEFLEQAMDLFPNARRALLTAYADTDAAIQAINVIDLDHYLLKPWEPPDEKLYPVVDELIELWRDTGDQQAGATRVVGHRWSARSYEVRDFLARNSVAYRWLTADEPEGRRLLEAAGLDEAGVPLVVTPEGDALVDPGVEELAARVGLPTTPATGFYDTVIVGGGPAGLGAAVYAASEGLRTVLVEREATGGQAGQSARIENYLGFPDGVSGAQLTDRARRQAGKFGAEVLTAATITGLEARGSSRVVRFADGGEVAAHTVVLATGVSYHTLKVPGVAELTGRGVFYGSAATEAPACADEDVYVVGAPTPPARRPCSCPGTPGESPCWSAPTAWSAPCRTTSSARSVTPPTSRCGPTPRSPEWRGPSTWRACASATAIPARSRRCRRPSCSCSSGRRPAPTGSTGWSSATPGALSSPAPTCSAAAGGRAAGRWTATPTTWRAASQACSPPATPAPTR